MPTLSFSAPVLALEASSTAGSVAVWCDGQLIGHEAVVMGAGQDDRLFPAIQRVLESAKIAPSALRSVVCGSGPGSFTSLRIAAALAKGLAHGAGATMYAVPSLLVAAASIESLPAAARAEGVILHADALRGERYVQPVRLDAGGLVTTAGPLARVAIDALVSSVPASRRVGVLASPCDDDMAPVSPHIMHVTRAGGAWRDVSVPLDSWEPEYGRLAEAQVKWEERFGMALPDTPAVRA